MTDTHAGSLRQLLSPCLFAFLLAFVILPPHISAEDELPAANGAVPTINDALPTTITSSDPLPASILPGWTLCTDNKAHDCVTVTSDTTEFSSCNPTNHIKILEPSDGVTCLLSKNLDCSCDNAGDCWDDLQESLELKHFEEFGVKAFQCKEIMDKLALRSAVSPDHKSWRPKITGPYVMPVP
jgi:hypothetical protein